MNRLSCDVRGVTRMPEIVVPGLVLFSDVDEIRRFCASSSWCCSAVKTIFSVSGFQHTLSKYCCKYCDSIWGRCALPTLSCVSSRQFNMYYGILGRSEWFRRTPHFDGGNVFVVASLRGDEVGYFHPYMRDFSRVIEPHGRSVVVETCCEEGGDVFNVSMLNENMTGEAWANGEDHFSSRSLWTALRIAFSIVVEQNFRDQMFVYMDEMCLESPYYAWTELGRFCANRVPKDGDGNFLLSLVVFKDGGGWAHRARYSHERRLFSCQR